MHLHTTDDLPDTPTQRKADRRRLLRALNASLVFVLLLCAVYVSQGLVDWRAWAVAPGDWSNWRGFIGAPLLHGSFGHLAANAGALLLLGTLAGTTYPRATLRALPLLWLGSGLGAWWLGTAGTHHLGASGVTHGLMFLVFVLGVLRRDRPAIAAAMIAFLMYGGMLLTILPHEAGVSWQSHLGGAAAGVLSALLFRNADPVLPRRQYSWELEEALEDARLAEDRDQFEPASPAQVPVLWARVPEATGVVLPFDRGARDARGAPGDRGTQARRADD